MITFACDNQRHLLTISDRKGEFAGTLDNRTIKVVFVTENQDTEIAIERNSNQIINYKGLKTIVKANL